MSVCLSVRVDSTRLWFNIDEEQPFPPPGRVQRRKRGRKKYAGERWRKTGFLPEQERQCRSKCHFNCVWQRVTRRVGPVGQVGPSVTQVLLKCVFALRCGTLTSFVKQCEVSPWGACCAANSLLVSTPVVPGDSQLKGPLGFEAEPMFVLSFPVVYQPSNTATESGRTWVQIPRREPSPPPCRDCGLGQSNICGLMGVFSGD